MIDNLTKEEIDRSISKINNLEGLNFKYKDQNNSNHIFNFIGNTFEVIFDPNQETTFRERQKLNNLIKWNSEITIKVIHLRNTFVYLSTYFERHKQSNNQKDNQYYKYFAEIITYYYVATRDNILQLINSYFHSPIEEEYKVTLNSVKNILKSENNPILKIIDTFENNSKKFREEIRNGFTHKTNPFNDYYITNLEGENRLGIFYSKTIDNDEFYNQLIHNLRHLSEYIESLRKILI